MPQEKGFLSSVWKAHTTVSRYLGLFGLPVVFAMAPKAATLAKAANPEANLFDILIQLWTMMGQTAMEYLVPGGSIILGEIGSTLGSVFNAASGAIGHAMPAPSLSPAP
ncbi:MAG: hypothetical protein IT558_03655 [Alphaproteobacteria bacterium]|nr:hypothetical protein [Alphaproteobacteria bacterium]